MFKDSNIFFKKNLNINTRKLDYIFELTGKNNNIKQVRNNKIDVYKNLFI